MQHIWQLGTCSVKQVVERLVPAIPYTTVASVFGNLKRKDYVSQQRVGKGYVYTPLIEASEYKQKFMTSFVRDYFRGSFKEMVSFFAKDEQLSKEDLDDIIREIEQG